MPALLGANRAVDFRLITTTSRDVAQAMRDGRLRMDFYYRINAVRVQVPPLRERGDDIALLAEEFLRQYAAKYSKRVRGFSADALSLILNYDWPGNVRELKHVIERAVVFCSADRLQRKDLSSISLEKIKLPARDLSSSRLEDTERELIQQALARTGGNVARAAHLLKLNQSTLYRKMRRFHLTE